MSSTDFAERAATLDGDLRGAPIGARAVRPRVEALQGLTKSNLSERSLADFSKQLRHFHDRLENLVDNSRGLRGALSGEPISAGKVGVLNPADGGAARGAVCDPCGHGPVAQYGCGRVD